MGKTLSEKVWDEHVVRSAEGEPDLLFIDLHLIHEVTSPQAFDGLRLAGRGVRRPDLTLATEDHNVPTLDWDKPIADPVCKTQVDTLRRNAEEFGVRLHPLGDVEQGIVHVVGPQLGLTQPGMTIVCGDSHTSTHGAFGSIAFGIGTSEVEHVLATQTLMQAKPKTMAVTVNGSLPDGVTAKDLVLSLITHDGHRRRAGLHRRVPRPGHRGALDGGAHDDLQHEHRVGRQGRPDRSRPDHLRLHRGPTRSPQGRRLGRRRRALEDPGHRRGRRLRQGARPRREHDHAVRHLGHQPRPGRTSGRHCALPEDFEEEQDRIAAEKALEYMGLEAGTPLRDVKVDTVFVGSCTNGRIEDLRLAAEVIKGHKVAADTRLLVVPGSVRVRLQAEEEGLDVIFKEAGGEWRGAGCSMCLGMNPDQLTPGERSASTSNRNFEGRQGKGGRTHLVSIPVAAATAIRGTLSSPADLVKE